MVEQVDKAYQHQSPLSAFASNRFSQNGEDGIINRIFTLIGTTSRLCCEFGAWDGVCLSNTRSLLLDGWSGLLIECDSDKYQGLCQNYKDQPGVVCLKAKVDDQSNTVSRLLSRAGIPKELDFLSIDVDGMDYYCLESLDIRPRLICVEAHAAHNPESRQLVSREAAGTQVGQPLQCFCDVADRLGYRLVFYTGNAFFLHRAVGFESELPTLSALEAYQQFLLKLSNDTKLWLYLMNRGQIYPFFRFQNPLLTPRSLQLSMFQRMQASVRCSLSYLKRGLFETQHSTAE
jgi:hypothetical protein